MGGVVGTGSDSADSAAAGDDPPSIPPERAALGDAVIAHVDEVAESVAASVLGNRPPGRVADMIRERILRDCSWATHQVGVWLRTGQVAPSSRRLDLAARGRELVDGSMSMADMTKTYLLWRDAVLRVLEEEAGRLDVDPGTVALAQAGIRHSCDATLVSMVKQYDAGRRDLQERLATEHAKLTHLALHDPLTGLANRALLIDRLDQALCRAGRRPGGIALLYLDLNGFKQINDRYGHQAGDRVLIEVGRRLAAQVRTCDTVARIGGDEFVICCDQLCDGPGELAAIVDRVRTAVAAPLPDFPGECVTASIGTVLAAPESDTDAMLRAADEAMYGAKRGRTGDTLSVLPPVQSSSTAPAGAPSTDHQ